MTEKFSLKDHLFNQGKVEKIAREIQSAYPSFQTKRFIHEVTSRFPELELKARISWIAECLKKYLPGNYRQAVEMMLRSLPPPNNPGLTDNDFGDFIYAPYADFVARYGCNKADLAFSLDALYELTMRFSAEDAIRYFINAFPDETMKTLLKWSTDPHYHVRRLCSEGTRPKLPWSQKIKIPVTAPVQILDSLFFDPTRFVVRSVANHVNDISKTDPALAIQMLTRWKKSKKQATKEMDYIIRHGLRTLIKTGNPDAMKLLGVSHKVDVSVLKFKVPPKVELNSALEFSFVIQAQEDAQVIVDYTLYFQNQSGKLSGKKVFKLKNLLLAKGTPVALSKRHMLREHMTTRKIFRGRHEIEIQVNGKPFGRKKFVIY
jgi:3-methyladenine DNA glycosylase AlkC